MTYDQIGVIGDTLTYQAGAGQAAIKNALIAAGWASADVRVDGVINRGINVPVTVATPTPYTRDVIRSWRATGFDPRVWLFALGTSNYNEPAEWTGQIQSVIDEVFSGDRTDYQIYWMGLGFRDTTGAYASAVAPFQAKLDEFDLANSFFHAIDYNATLTPRRSSTSWASWWDSTSGVTNTSSGYTTLRVPLYASAVAAEVPDGNSDPSTPPSAPIPAANKEPGSLVLSTDANAMLNHLRFLENQNSQLASRVSALESVPPSSSSGGPITMPGFINIDAYTGTDDDRIAATVTYQRAQQNASKQRPTTLLHGRRTFTRTINMDGGLRISGPSGVGIQHPERGSGYQQNTLIQLNVGNGLSSWLVGTNEYFGGYLGDLSFKSLNNNAQIFDQSTGNAYGMTFHNIATSGFKHIIGRRGAHAIMTLCQMTGIWNCTGIQDTPFWFKGSDNKFIPEELNLGPQGEPTRNGYGRYLVETDELKKTRMANFYLTCDGEWRGLHVNGSSSGKYSTGLIIRDWVIEGRSPSKPSLGHLVYVTGNPAVKFLGLDINFGGADPDRFNTGTWQADAGYGSYKYLDRGIFHITGGRLRVRDATYDASISAANQVTFPFVYATGASTNVRVKDIDTSNFGHADGTVQPYVKTASGATAVIDDTVRMAP